MAKKKAVGKKPSVAADRGQGDTVLVKLYLPTEIRNRLRALAAFHNVNMNEAAAGVLDKHLPKWEDKWK